MEERTATSFTFKTIDICVNEGAHINIISSIYFSILVVVASRRTCSFSNGLLMVI